MAMFLNSLTRKRGGSLLGRFNSFMSRLLSIVSASPLTFESEDLVLRLLHAVRPVKEFHQSSRLVLIVLLSYVWSDFKNRHYKPELNSTIIKLQ